MRLLAAIGLWAVAAASVALDASRIEVEALMTNTAVLKIDGQRKMLKVGDTVAGVTLIAAYSQTATIEVDGKQVVLGISRRIGTHYEQPSNRVVTIKRNAMLQYHTTASINGRSIQVLVDTGANVVAMNTGDAASLGVDYRSGELASVETASGRVKAWIVQIGSINVGGIEVNNVQASVLEGSFPATVLLGMSYLQHVNMQEKNGTLSLTREW